MLRRGVQDVVGPQRQRRVAAPARVLDHLVDRAARRGPGRARAARPAACGAWRWSRRGGRTGRRRRVRRRPRRSTRGRAPGRSRRRSVRRGARSSGPSRTRGVEHAVALDQPAEVAGLGLAEHGVRPRAARAPAQLAHRGDRRPRAARALEQRADLFAGSLVEQRVRVLALWRQLHPLAARVVRRTVDQRLGLEALEQPAELAGVDRQLASERAGRLRAVAPSS